MFPLYNFLKKPKGKTNTNQYQQSVKGGERKEMSLQGHKMWHFLEPKVTVES